MDKAVHVGGADIAADDVIAIDEDVSVDGAVVIGVIGDNVGIAHNVLLFEIGEVESLLALDLVVAREYFIKLGGNEDLLFGIGGRFDLPAELLEEIYAILIAFYLFVVIGDGDARLLRIDGIGRDKCDKGNEGDEANAHDPEKFYSACTHGINKHKK